MRIISSTYNNRSVVVLTTISGPHDTQYCMENPEQAFVEYASSRTDEARGLVSNFMASQDARLSKFEADFKQQQSEMTNKNDTVLKAITDRIVGALHSDTVKNPKLNVNSTSLVLSARSYPTDDPQCSSHPSKSMNVVKKCFEETNPPQKDKPQPVTLGNSEPFDTLVDLGACVNVIPLYLFKKLNIRLLEKTNHVFRLADGTKSYPIRIVRDVEVHIGRLKLLTDFYVIDMKNEPETPLLVGRGFLATPNAVIDCRKAKITEIAKDSEINLFKEVLVFRRMVEFLGAIPINLNRNMWESKDLIKSPINWDKPPKNGDEVHAKIRLIDPDGEEFTKTLQSVPTSRKLSEKEDQMEIIDLDHFYDTKFFKENEKKIFSEAGDGVRIYPNGVVIFDEKKLSQEKNNKEIDVEFRRKAHLLEDKQIPNVRVFDKVFLALGWHLKEIHVTWAHLKKKRTRLRTYTKSLEELCIQSVETASQA
ncbi:MAK10-like protein [Tanacetum coccineum]